MKTMLKLFSLVLVAATFLTACTPAAKANTPSSTPQQIQVTEADQGKSFSLNSGDTLVVVLDSNPSTGYSWAVQPVEKPVVSLSGEPVFSASNNKLGASGKAILTFKTVGSGSQTLILNYQRPFEKGAQPAKTFTLNVTVSK